MAGPFWVKMTLHQGIVPCQLLRRKVAHRVVVVMDNAAIHPSEEFEECLAKGEKEGLIIKYLSTYSPALNLIEILWRNIKYAWVPFSAYQCLIGKYF